MTSAQIGIILKDPVVDIVEVDITMKLYVSVTYLSKGER